MSKTKTILSIAAALMMTGFAAQADTGALRSKASTTIGIRAFVPVLCRVQFAADVGTVGDDGIVELGKTEEFCNAPRGYRVIVEHEANLDGAAFISDGVRIPLSSTGETVLTDSIHPDIRSMNLALDLGKDHAQLHSLGVRIEAKA